MKCIYCLEFTDGKRYIGSTKDLKQRIKCHNYPTNSLKTNPELKAAILKGDYEVVILEHCPDDYNRKQLEAREQHYVNLWFDYGILYNKRKTVSGGWNKGKKTGPLSDKTKANISASKKGKTPKNKGKRYSQSYQRADEIIADRAAGMAYYALRIKYKTGVCIIKDILFESP